uniref:Twin-arginine translocation pathway signal:YD repeat n=1 Tax=Nonomuraea gerenzanensis TaxID=93944 RepID=A0A1M4E604_9ACTN|nr:Twin-arginine translocation pathway signal:YD repeat [Nonomuraea gerenzanensis]
MSDPAGRPLRAGAEIEHDPAAPDGQGTGQIWIGSVDNVPEGSQASIAVLANTLSDGWKVRWRVRAVSPTATSSWSDWQTFTINLPEPSATGLTITPSKVVDGTTVTTTLTPAFAAKVTDPAGGALRANRSGVCLPMITSTQVMTLRGLLRGPRDPVTRGDGSAYGRMIRRAPSPGLSDRHECVRRAAVAPHERSGQGREDSRPASPDRCP